MAKQNTTYNRGFHLDHSFDPLEFEREQKKKRREERRRGGGAVPQQHIKQTMDLEFGVRCLSCQFCMPRRKRIYARVTRVEKDPKYNEWIHEFEFHCMKCGTMLALRSELERRLETGGFVCHRGCERLAGGYDEAQAQDAEREAAKVRDKADENFEGEIKVKEHQALEEEAAKLAALVDRQNSRDALATSKAAMELVTRTAEEREHERASETAVPLTIEDENYFKYLRRERGYTRFASIRSPEQVRELLGIDSFLRTLEQHQNEPPAAAAPAPTTSSPPATATGKAEPERMSKAPRKRKNVLDLLSSDYAQ